MQKSFKQFFFFRTLLALAICYYHAISSMNLIYSKAKLTAYYAGRDNASIAVDCFFIMAGFLVAYRFEPNIFIFIKKRLIRLLPAFYICVIFSFIVSLLGVKVPYAFRTNQTLYTLLSNLFLFNIEQKNILLVVSWFIYPLFWISLGYVILRKYVSQTLLTIFLGILIFISYTLVDSYGIYIWRHVFGLPIGFYRGLGGICAGIILYQIYNLCPPFIQKINRNFYKYFSTFCEIVLVFILIYLLFFANAVSPFLIISTFVILFFFSLQENKPLEKIWGNSFFKGFSDISYMVFLSHETVFAVTTTLSNYFHFIPKTPLLYLLILIYNAIIVSGVLYFFLERPIIRYLKTFLLKKHS